MTTSTRSRHVSTVPDSFRTGISGEPPTTCPPAPLPRGRTGGSDGGQATPTVLISNLDQAPLPTVAKALKVAELARAAGWWVRVGYAKAEVPAHHYLNGNLAKAAHVLESVGVQFRRPAAGGRAMWHRENGGGWTFEHAFIGTEAFGWSTSGKTKLRSILEGIME